MTFDHLARESIRENLIAICRAHRGGVTNSELWDQLQIPSMFCTAGFDLPIFPVIPQ